MRILALSDCHYKYHRTEPADTDNAQILQSFLSGCVGKYDVLVLGGDIFDLWFDWKFSIVKQYFPILRLLADIHDAGCRIIYISGNHDFWFGDFLTRYIGCEIQPEGCTLKMDGKIIRFEHGDTRTVNDLRYQIYRRIIRLSGMKRLFSLLHPDFALSLGTLLSRTSRKRPRSSDERNRRTGGLYQYAEKLIRSRKADIVVMGHSHKPDLIHIAEGCYANCGDWLEHHTYIEITDGSVELKHYQQA